MRVNNTTFAALLLGLFIASTTSCKKDKTEPESVDLVPAYPQPADANATLVTIRSTVASPIPNDNVNSFINLNMGLAIFKSDPTSASTVKVAKVLLNGTELSYKNGFYIYQPDINSYKLGDKADLGLNPGAAEWRVPDGEGFPLIVATIYGSPGTPYVTSQKQIAKAQGFTITNNAPSSATKTVYYIYSSGNQSVHKEVNGSSSSCTFSQQELESLGASTAASVQVNAYISSDRMISGKKVYFISQSSFTQAGVEIK